MRMHKTWRVHVNLHKSCYCLRKLYAQWGPFKFDGFLNCNVLYSTIRNSQDSSPYTVIICVGHKTSIAQEDFAWRKHNESSDKISCILSLHGNWHWYVFVSWYEKYIRPISLLLNI